jgi:acylphosphatase
VRNLSDGRVEVVAAGDAAGIDVLARALDRGPPGAAVSGVEAENLVDGTAFKSFDIQ